MRHYAALFSLPFIPLGPMQAGVGWKSDAGGVVAVEMVGLCIGRVRGCRVKQPRAN
jgi:hypothetical protein